MIYDKLKTMSMQKLLLLLVLIASLLDANAAVKIDGINYELNTSNKTASVTSGGDYSGNVVIPGEITYDGETYSVTSIGDEAFDGCSSLMSINIPNSVTSIGEWAFAYCSGLTSINIPNSVISIGGRAFYECSWLTSITIGSSVTNIGELAFYGCSSLTGINIPNSVTSIGYDAFLFCSGLTSIQVAEGNSKYDSRNGCNAIIETESNRLIVGCKNTIIPNSVTSIGEYAFDDCSSLTSINIPNSVTSIGDDAFYGCI